MLPWSPCPLRNRTCMADSCRRHSPAAFCTVTVGSQFIPQAQEALTAAIASDTPQQLAEACNLVVQSGLEESEIKDHFEEAKTRIMGVIGEVRTQAP